MSGQVYGTAVYADALPGEITVTQDGDETGAKFQGPRDGPPGTRHLVPTPWAHVPGQSWQTDETGAWYIRVYRHAEP